MYRSPILYAGKHFHQLVPAGMHVREAHSIVPVELTKMRNCCLRPFLTAWLEAVRGEPLTAADYRAAGLAPGTNPLR